MRLRDRLREALATPYLAHRGWDEVPLESPFASPNHLVSVPHLDEAPRQVTRAAAMTIPAIKRARGLIVGSIARCPLEARSAGKRLTDQPLWLTRTDGVQSPHFRMTWTVDDLLFYGWSLWGLERDYDGRVIRADRVPIDLWDVDQRTGEITVNGREADASEVCLIPGPDEGILRAASDMIRHALDLNRAAAKAAETPVAQIDLHQKSGPPLPDEEIRRVIDSWVAARKGANGGVAFSSPTVEVRPIGQNDPGTFVEARNVVAVEIARMMGVPASLIDAHTAGSGNLTYSNDQVRNIRLIDYGLAPYMAAVVARLGLDDMVPRGTAVAFDIGDLTSDTIGEVDVPDDDHSESKGNEELENARSRQDSAHAKALHSRAQRPQD